MKVEVGTNLYCKPVTIESSMNGLNVISLAFSALADERATRAEQYDDNNARLREYYLEEADFYRNTSRDIYNQLKAEGYYKNDINIH